MNGSQVLVPAIAAAHAAIVGEPAVDQAGERLLEELGIGLNAVTAFSDITACRRSRSASAESIKAACDASRIPELVDDGHFRGASADEMARQETTAISVMIAGASISASRLSEIPIGRSGGPAGDLPAVDGMAGLAHEPEARIPPWQQRGLAGRGTAGSRDLLAASERVTAPRALAVLARTAGATAGGAVVVVRRGHAWTPIEIVFGSSACRLHGGGSDPPSPSSEPLEPPPEEREGVRREPARRVALAPGDRRLREC